MVKCFFKCNSGRDIGDCFGYGILEEEGEGLILHGPFRRGEGLIYLGGGPQFSVIHNSANS